MQISLVRPVGRSRTLADEIYTTIQDDIVKGAFSPGQALRLEALSERYGVSFTPLREALNQLQAEGLVTSSGMRGFRVPPVTLPEMWQTIHARVLVETEAMALAFSRGNVDWEIDVVSAYHALNRMREMVNEGRDLSIDEREAVERRHEHFHLTLLSPCSSDILLRLIGNLHRQSERYRRRWVSRSEPETLGNAAPDEDHEALMQAALARDTDTASRILRRHLMATGEFIQAQQIASGEISATELNDAKPIYDRLIGGL